MPGPRARPRPREQQGARTPRTGRRSEGASAEFYDPRSGPSARAGGRHDAPTAGVLRPYQSDGCRRARRPGLTPGSRLTTVLEISGRYVLTRRRTETPDGMARSSGSPHEGVDMMICMVQQLLRAARVVQTFVRRAASERNSDPRESVRRETTQKERPLNPQWDSSSF